MTGRWEHFEHTADLGLRATGATLGEAFAACAEALFAYIAEPARVAPTGEFGVFLEADAPEDLLVHWLEELRFASETRGVLFHRFEADVRLGTPCRLAGKAWGEAYDAAKHGHMHEVKAITRHHLLVQRDPPKVEVVLDI